MALNNIPSNISKKRGNWQVVVNPKPAGWMVEVWLLNVSDGRASIANIDKNGFIKVKELKPENSSPGPEDKPFMVLPGDIWQLFVDAVTESTPPTKKEVVEGVLESTKFHLEDMRKLVFKGWSEEKNDK